MQAADARDEDVEWVVLLDDSGRPSGQAPKHLVHTTNTPLHLAFSCWVIDPDGRTLLTQRAMTKRTWPGAWTNTVCGHPAPNEPIDAAVRRRAAHELGVDLRDLEVALPDFRYRAVMTDGTVENEICPVYTAEIDTTPVPHASEVADYRWVELDALRAAVARDSASYSPWMLEQLALLER